MKRLLSILAVVAAFLLGQAVVAYSAGSQDLTTLLANFLYNGTLGRAFLFSPDNTYDIGAAGATRPANGYFGGQLIFGAGQSRANSASDGVVALTNNTATDFSRLQFGGTTSSFPALARSGSALRVRLADNSTDAGLYAAAVLMNNAGSYLALGASDTKLIVATAPTISSGFGTSPSISASNGTAAFVINVGTGGAASSGVIGLPTAATGWIVFCDDMTTPTTNETKQTASSTTTATVTNYNTTTGIAANWASASTVRCIAMAY